MIVWKSIAATYVILALGLCFANRVEIPMRVAIGRVAILSILKALTFMEAERWFWRIPSINFLVSWMVFYFLTALTEEWWYRGKGRIRALLWFALADTSLARVLVDQCYSSSSGSATAFMPDLSLARLEIEWWGLAYWAVIPDWSRGAIGVAFMWILVGLGSYGLARIMWARRHGIYGVCTLALVQASAVNLALPRLFPFRMVHLLMLLLGITAISGIGSWVISGRWNATRRAVAGGSLELSVMMSLHHFGSWIINAKPVH